MTKAKAVEWMKVALVRRKMTKCIRAAYCTIMFDADGNDVCTGVNGKPAGSKCDDYCFRLNLPPDAAAPPCCIHSEINALIRGPFERFRGGTALVSGLPCTGCALALCNTGIAQLVCLEDRRGYNGLDEIKKHGLPIEVMLLTEEEVNG